MQFDRSETKINLARAIAGESQARQRYTVFAEQARQEGMEYLARIFEETAHNEHIHAKEFTELLNRRTEEPLDNIDITAGYPHNLGTTAENLADSAKNEMNEYESVYPAFSAKAQEEGFPDAAQLFKLISIIEGLHHRIFTDAHKQLTEGTLYHKDTPTVWRCLNCGYIYSADEPHDRCPVCHKGPGWAEGTINEKQLN